MIILVALSLGCEPPAVPARAAEARRRFLTDDYAAALSVTEETLAALPCVDTLVSASDLLSLYQTGVAAAAETQASAQARAWSEAAARLLPDAAWPLDVLGAPGAHYWDAARAAGAAPVRVTLDGPLWIDGRPAGDGTITLPPGPHLIQEMLPDGTIRSGWRDVTDTMRLAGSAPTTDAPAQGRPLRPVLLGAGATLLVGGSISMFLASEDLFCAGQLLADPSGAGCEPLIRDYEGVTRADYDRLSDRGLALRAVGLGANLLGGTSLVIGWMF